MGMEVMLLVLSIRLILLELLGVCCVRLVVVWVVLGVMLGFS